MADGHISAVGMNLAAPSMATVVDGAGGTLLPGPIDAHTHTMSVTDLHQALTFGVSTELDMFCPPQLLAPLREAAAARDDVADLRSAGTGVTTPGGQPTDLVEAGMLPSFPTLGDLDEAEGFVAAHRRRQRLHQDHH